MEEPILPNMEITISTTYTSFFCLILFYCDIITMESGTSSKTYVALFKSIHYKRKSRVSITCTISQLPRNTGYSSIHHLIFYVNNTSIKEFADKCKTSKY